jgi:predicted nuclease of predicted toxin-antitoxin system
MRFKLDENLPSQCAKLLLENGFNTETVIQEGLQGCSDQIIIEACQSEDRILITLDLDFSDIRNYPPGSNPGIIVLRLPEQSIAAAQNSIMRLISSFSQELPTNKLWIVDESKIRIRE